ncbi:hypothetical protein [Scytonema sp. PCC 10023]
MTDWTHQSPGCRETLLHSAGSSLQLLSAFSTVSSAGDWRWASGARP